MISSRLGLKLRMPRIESFSMLDISRCVPVLFSRFGCCADSFAGFRRHLQQEKAIHFRIERKWSIFQFTLVSDGTEACCLERRAHNLSVLHFETRMENIMSLWNRIGNIDPDRGECREKQRVWRTAPSYHKPADAIYLMEAFQKSRLGVRNCERANGGNVKIW